jgi:copper chaperone CopZ
MRGFAYVIAVLAAVGIMIGIVSFPDQTAPNHSEDGPDRSAAEPVSASPTLMAEAGTLTLAVPAMHCEFACFPKVKKTLESTNGIQSVALAAQKEDGVIDNRQVIVNYDTGFDLNAALVLLVEEGFPDSNVVQ